MSTDNPYAPPLSNFVPRSSYKYSGIGIYCDQGNVVLSRSNYKFPAVCLKTGQATDGIYPLRVRTLPRGKSVAIAVAFGAVGLAIARSMFGTNFQIDVPMVPGWVNPNAPTKEQSKRGWGAVGIGLLLIVLGIMLSLFAEVFMILCAIGLLVGIVGFFLGGYKSSKKPFEITTFDSEYIWLDGVEKNLAYEFEPLPSK